MPATRSIPASRVLGLLKCLRVHTAVMASMLTITGALAIFTCLLPSHETRTHVSVTELSVLF